MGSEVKWYFIAIAVIFGGGMAAAAYSDNQKNECRVAALQQHMTADEIKKICN